MGRNRDIVLGGQAVIEGVMMKSPGAYAVAVRRPCGEILVHTFPISPRAVHRRFARTPVVRGVVTMGAMLAIGYRALQFSADQASADGGEPPSPAARGLASVAAAAVAVALALALFVWLPLALARLLAALAPALSGPMAFNLADGAFRVAVFLGYVLAISALPDVRRVFEYHGAEHKVINAHEAGADLDPASVAAFPRIHPRCGTSFLLYVMVVGVAVFSLIPHGTGLAGKALMRLLLLPAVAGISYELLRLSARRADAPPVRALAAPGLLLQRLTTREPGLDQIEVALASFRRVAPPPEAGRVG